MNWDEYRRELEEKGISRNDFIEVTLDSDQKRRGVYGDQQGGTVGLYDYREEEWFYFPCEKVEGLEKTTMVLEDLGDYKSPDEVPDTFLRWNFNQHELPPFLSHRKI